MANTKLNPDLAEKIDQLASVAGISPDDVQTMLATQAGAQLERATEAARKKLQPRGSAGRRPRRRAAAE
jgi:hypothetical protein